MIAWRVAFAAGLVALGSARATPAHGAERATVWLQGSPNGCGCKLSIESGAGAALTIDPAKIHVAVIDARQRVVVAPNQFELLPPASAANGRTTIEVRGDATPRKAGMYALIATFDAGALGAGGAALDVESLPFHFYRGPALAHPPALMAGQRFFDAAADRVNSTDAAALADPALVDAAGAPLRREQVALHPLTLRAIDASISPHRLTFAIEGVGTATLRSDGDAANLPGLVPLVDDAEALRLERTYAGQHVWTVGGANLGCVSGGATVASGGVASDSEFVVQHVFRAAMLPTVFAGIGHFGANDRASTFVTNDPIIVALQPAGSTSFGGGAFSSTGTARPNIFDLRRECVAFSARFADGWDLERAFSRASLERGHPEWSADTIAHIRAGEVRVGMTHEMIAWMFGYAPVYGTAAEVDRLDTWSYDDPAPFASTVYFRRDRVTAYDPPGWLP